jgi:hypothetical protein
MFIASVADSPPHLSPPPLPRELTSGPKWRSREILVAINDQREAESAPKRGEKRKEPPQTDNSDDESTSPNLRNFLKEDSDDDFQNPGSPMTQQESKEISAKVRLAPPLLPSPSPSSRSIV